MTNTFDDIKRKAIDSSGILGSLYDGRRHCILKGNTIISKTQSVKTDKPIICNIGKMSSNKNFNFLQFIEIDQEIRLNLLLQLTKRVGIASVMNYSHRIDKYTRFFYYSLITKSEQLTSSPEEIQELHGSFDPQFQATHIVASVDLGIDLIAILQLPGEDGLISQIDNALDLIRQRLLNNNQTISSHETNLFRNILYVTVYSNMPLITGVGTFSDMLYQINRVKTTHRHTHPINYYLRSTKWLSSQYTSTNAALKTISKELNTQIEEYLLRMRNSLQYLEAFFNDYISKYLYGNYQNQIYNSNQQWTELKDKYKKERQKISNLVDDVRKGRFDSKRISEELRHHEQIQLEDSIDQLIEDIRQLKNKIQSKTNHSQEQLFNYSNRNDQTKNNQSFNEENDRNTKSGNINQFSLNKHLDNDHRYPVSSTANIQSSAQFEQTSNKNSYVENERTSSPVTIKDDFSSSTTNRLNIVLLGESGVGKSTFINAFVNYLNFDRLEQAELNEAHVIIPVSFLMTIGDEFEEREVTFKGKNSNFRNENLNSVGQSLTQNCQSYIFNLNDGTEVCLIDTPGFGDTRGIEQDQINLDNILQYLNHFKYLNGICFLLKPNSSRLNLFFRLCFNQLFDFLGPNLSHNVIFCFTNSRSTFYTPGDTAPLLRSMLSSLTIQSIPFEKANTFSFDSEAFRYLVARQNQIEFNDQEKEEYERSWNISVKESFRLINYIKNELQTYQLKDQWKSVKHAQFQINSLIRPILESIRNLLRNLLLKDFNESIQFNSIIVHRPVFLCYSCQPKLNQFDHITIKQDYPHEFDNQCLMCSCSKEKHYQVEYLINSKLVKNILINDQEEEEELKIISKGSAIFSCFLLNVVQSTKEDRFLTGLIKMIEEETNISKQQQIQSNHLNHSLVNQLEIFIEKYLQQFDQIKHNENHHDLDLVYQWINKINQIQMIKEQIYAVNKGQEILIKQRELYPNNI